MQTHCLRNELQHTLQNNDMCELLCQLFVKLTNSSLTTKLVCENWAVGGRAEGGAGIQEWIVKDTQMQGNDCKAPPDS